MKLTKKAAALLLAATLAVSVCATPVFAADPVHGTPTKKDDATDSSSQTEVKYNVTEGYTWAIPSKIDFGTDAGADGQRTVFADQKEEDGAYSAAKTDQPGSSGTVCVTNCRLKPGKKLIIAIDGDQSTHNGSGFCMNSEDTNPIELAYSIYQGKVTDFINSDSKLVGLNSNNKILLLDAGTDYKEQSLTFHLMTMGGGEYAGDYTGTLVFEAAVVNT